MKDGSHSIAREAMAKFVDPDITTKGERRASVPFSRLRTLWINTGTLCNITCRRCYIESSPVNDRLVYFAPADFEPFLAEAAALAHEPIEIGLTGGEPFMNPHCLELIEMALADGHTVLTLTNAMRPMMRPRVQDGLKALRARYGGKLRLRVSLDHYESARHDEERGEGGFAETAEGIDWLVREGFSLHLAGRRLWDEAENDARAGYAALCAARGWPIDADDHLQLVLFPEMDERKEVPEITMGCWGILGVDPNGLMCASARMLVKRQGAAHAAVVSCTLLPYEPAFELGSRLADALAPTKLNHRYCAQFCVLGGGTCSG